MTLAFPCKHVEHQAYCKYYCPWSMCVGGPAGITRARFIAQLKGWLTWSWYTIVMVFVNHILRLKYIFFQKTKTSRETIEAKHAFKMYCRQHGCQVQHYNCNNGCFADNGWMADAAHWGQTISFCSVNAHHQNGLVKKAIKDLQEQARKSLLHAKAR